VGEGRAGEGKQSGKEEHVFIRWRGLELKSRRLKSRDSRRKVK